MSKKRVIFIVVATVIIGLAVVLLLLDPAFFSGQNNIPGGSENEQQTEQRDYIKNTSDSENQTAAVNQAPVPTPQVQSVMAVARTFAERYGSYSSDSNFINLTELEPLSTSQLTAELERLKAAADFSQGFYGVSSKTLKVELAELDEAGGTAEVKVNLQREEVKQNNQPFIYYQDIVLSLIKSGDNWLINQAEWQ